MCILQGWKIFVCHINIAIWVEPFPLGTVQVSSATKQIIHVLLVFFSQNSFRKVYDFEKYFTNIGADRAPVKLPWTIIIISCRLYDVELWNPLYAARTHGPKSMIIHTLYPHRKYISTCLLLRENKYSATRTCIHAYYFNAEAVRCRRTHQFASRCV